MARLSKTQANKAPATFDKLADLEGHIIQINAVTFQDSPFTKNGETPNIEAVCLYQEYTPAVGVLVDEEERQFSTSHTFILRKLRNAEDGDFPLIAKIGRATWAENIKRQFGQYPFDLIDPSDEELAPEDR